MHSEDGAPAARCMHNARLSTSACWVAAPQCQPTNANRSRGHFRTTLTIGRPASPTLLHGPHCRTPVPGLSPVTARSHRCDTLYTNRAALSVVRFLLIHYRKPSRQPGYLRLHLVGAADVSFCKRDTCLRLTC